MAAEPTHPVQDLQQTLAVYQRDLAVFVLQSLSQALQLAGLVMTLFYVVTWVVTEDAPGRWVILIAGTFGAAALLWSVASSAPTLRAHAEAE